ncbi:uncharacterized protein YbjT (DUF2867 family) [Salirhabdus euzebyi]|uniref:Uncharacterized protein YbjT (DUF2867 family) n=1 Tax=Salirhabdus euzebyi TaxID=394506 RepID=A0A841Q4G7_9BACI|nr:SDR family oxidoreductase [Salirhabdus euzebyi]MBB6453230.1 uncharacterized protein YbjT (DUF2867 family) [Salirhabdus euzebyi]
MKKVLVTGATGNVGKYVVDELLKKGERVIAAGPSFKNPADTFSNKVETVYFDFKKPETFQGVLNDVDRVFLMRPPHLGKPEDLYPFIDEMKLSKIKLVSFLSLMGVEKNTIPPHHKIEKYIEDSELPYAHVRPGFFMQNVSGVQSKEIREKSQVFVPAGNSKTSFIDAADIGLAVATLLHDPESYQNTAHTITGSEALDYYQVAQILSEETGKNIKYAKPSYWKYRRYYIKKRRLDKKYVNVTVALYFMTRMGTAKEVTNDFIRLTGRKPRTFKEFVKENRSSFTS